MAIYINSNKKIIKLLANVNGQKKVFTSVWVNKNGISTKVYGQNNSLNNGTFYISSGIYHALSKNGKDWEKITSFPSHPFAYGNGKIVSFTNDRTSIYSTDGINWESGYSIPAGTVTPDDIIFTNNKFICYGIGSYPIFYSEDGIKWTSTGYTSNNSTFLSMSFGNNIYTLSISGDIYYSNDLINWTEALRLTYYDFQSITFGDNKFVAVASYYKSTTNAGKIYYSDDGINWIEVVNTPFVNKLFSVTYTGKYFIAVGAGEYAYYSDNGIDWKRNNGLNADAQYNNILFANNMCIAVGNYFPYYSDDGVNWNKCNSIISNPLETGTYVRYKRIAYVPNSSH